MSDSRQAFIVDKSLAGHWRVTVDNPPINVIDDGMYDALYDLVGEIEADAALKAVTFENANPEFFSHYGTSGPRSRFGVPRWINAAKRLANSGVLSIAVIRGRIRPRSSFRTARRNWNCGCGRTQHPPRRNQSRSLVVRRLRLAGRRTGLKQETAAAHTLSVVVSRRPIVCGGGREPPSLAREPTGVVGLFRRAPQRLDRGEIGGRERRRQLPLCIGVASADAGDDTGSGRKANRIAPGPRRDDQECAPHEIDSAQAGVRGAGGDVVRRT